MSESVNVKIIERGKDGDTCCFELRDFKGEVYVLDNCHAKETFGLLREGYQGMCNEHIAHLNIYPNGNAELVFC